jgi:hypothetical protein
VNVAGKCAWYGVTFSLGDSTDANFIRLAYGDGGTQYFQDCSFVLGGSNAGNNIGLSDINWGDIEAKLTFVNCTFSWASNQQYFYAACPATFIDCDLSSGSSHPANGIFYCAANGTPIELIGCDLSDISPIGNPTPTIFPTFILRQCKLKSSGTIFAPTSAGRGEAFVYDCSDGDNHYVIAHYDYQGSTVATPAYYANDNIGDVGLSWLVAGNANTTKACPYFSPWLAKYHSATSAITPYLEALRVDSTAMYDEDQVWLEVTAKTTSGSTRVDFYTNRSDALTSGVDNASSSKTYSDFTGSPTATDSGDSTLKLELNASITPAEAGHISVRVGVSGNYAVYIDPQIRGLS